MRGMESHRIPRPAVEAARKRLTEHFRNVRRLANVEDMLEAAWTEKRNLHKALAAGIEVVTLYPSSRLSHAPVTSSPDRSSPPVRAVEYADEVRERMEQRLVEVVERIRSLELERGQLAESVAEVRAAIDVLDVECVDVLHEYFQHGRRIYQIAHDLHCSQSTVRRRLVRITRIVARELGLIAEGPVTDN